MSVSVGEGSGNGVEEIVVVEGSGVGGACLLDVGNILGCFAIAIKTRRIYIAIEFDTIPVIAQPSGRLDFRSPHKEIMKPIIPIKPPTRKIDNEMDIMPRIIPVVLSLLEVEDVR